MTPDATDGEPREALESLLRWYVAMGVDAAIDEASHDRFASPEPTPPSRAEHLPTPPRAAGPSRAPLEGPAASAETLVRQAREIAAGAATIEALREAWNGFGGCALASTAARMIFAGGNPASRIMLFGAAPGSDDERGGEAFTGAAGRLVDGMLAAIGLSRQAVYLANVIPWRPPGNRAPTPLEAALCLPFTRRHIALADPRLILCLGERAAQLLLGTADPLSRLRGRWLSYEGEATTVKLAVTFSLDYLLSQPLQKKRAWIDLIAFAKMVEIQA